MKKAVNTVAEKKRDVWQIIFGILFVMMCISSGIRVVGKSFEGKTAFVRWMDATEKVSHGETVYFRAVYEQGGRWAREGFPYLPMMTVILMPLHKLGPVAGSICWMLIKCEIILFIFWAVTLFWRDNNDNHVPRWLPAALLLINFRVFMGDLTHGNVNIIIGGFIVAALVSTYYKKDFLAGLAVALASILKVTPVLFVLYFMYKRRWISVAGFAVGILLFGLLVPGTVLGFEFNWQLTADWYDQMIGPFVSGRPEGMRPTLHINQSLYGLFYRLLSDCVAVVTDVWKETGNIRINFVSLSGQTIGWILKILYLIILSSIAWVSRTPREDRKNIGNLGEFALVFLAMLFISERSWKHHYILIILSHAFILAYLLNTKPEGWKKWVPAGFLAGALIFHSVFSESIMGEYWSNMSEAYGVYILGGIFLFIGCSVVLKLSDKAGQACFSKKTSIT
ncbi:glycosyltransferase family 87 protein [Verrucomicrobiota bacterium]